MRVPREYLYGSFLLLTRAQRLEQDARFPPFSFFFETDLFNIKDIEYKLQGRRLDQVLFTNTASKIDLGHVIR